MRQKNSDFNLNLLSIVIPAYKQEKTIEKDIKNIMQVLNDLEFDYELIIVVDGLVDKTFEKLSRIKNPRLKIIAYEKNQGKGHAIRLGMLHSKGDVIGFMDSGMDIHPAGLRMLLSHMEWYNADIIVGSKMHPVSKVDYPLYRTILSWGYRLFTAMLFGFKVKDTQVGLKFLKRNVVEDVLPRLVVKRFAFDIEILAVAYNRGFRRIYEAPVEINFGNNSSITSIQLWKTIYSMLWDTCAVFYRLKILRYYDKKREFKFPEKFKKSSKNMQPLYKNR